jgi:hypothetical protein
MNNSTLQIKFKQRLNKLDSMDYDNIECWQIAEAFNKAQIEWARRQLHGHNGLKEQPEQSITAIDDLQVLLVQRDLKLKNLDLFFESLKIPDDYLHFVRVSGYASSDCCPRRPLSIYQAEEANVDIMLSDSFKSPSFEWAETFCTIMGDKIRIYSDNKFAVDDVTLTYYRKPRTVQILGCVDPANGLQFKANQTCELRDDIIEIIIDDAVAILAGDMDNTMQYQRNLQNATRNS